MKNMSLCQVARACNGQLFPESYEDLKEVTGVVIDSRQILQDHLFIATVGERVDGHDFIPSAYEKGAIAVVCETAPIDPKGPYILVKSSFQALKDIAVWYRSQLQLKVVGITGSVGKTSTKEFISSVLAQKYRILKTEGNYNNEVGLPLTLLKIRDYHEIAVLEMGISDFGEMHRLSEIAKPDICVITNIGQCHLENLGSREGILKAKTEIFDFMADDGFVCLNGDDDLLATITEVKGRKPLLFGLTIRNDIYATDIISHGLFGSTCTIHSQNLFFEAQIPQPGEHMVLNALAATSVGTLLQLTTQEIATGIEAVQSLGGRSNIIRQDKLTIIDDCYNANPVSMKAALDLLAKADTRKIAILGDMFELGEGENALHAQIGAYAATTNIDVLVCVGKLSYHMNLSAAQCFKGELLYYETRDELIEALPNIIVLHDTVLVKASHGMGFDQVVKALIN